MNKNEECTLKYIIDGVRFLRDSPEWRSRLSDLEMFTKVCEETSISPYQFIEKMRTYAQECENLIQENGNEI